MKNQESTATDDNEPQMTIGLRASLVCIVLSIGAMVVAVVLTVGYYEHVVGGRATGCAITSYVDCDKVSSSRFATIAGVPLSVLGFTFQLFLMSLLVSGLISRSQRSQATVAATMVLFTAAGSIVSVALAFISLAIIRALCIYCTMLQVLNIAMFIVVATQIRERKVGTDSELRPSLRRITSQLIRPRLAILLIAAAVAVAGGVLLTVAMEQRAANLARRGIADDGDALINLYFGEEVQELSAGDSPAMGRNDLGAQIIVFSDYNCVHCRDADSQLQQLVDDFDGQIELVFKFFPLDSDCNPFIEDDGTSTSCEAAAAAYLSHEQGMFWQYHNRLFESFEEYSRAQLIGYAQDVGIPDSLDLANRLEDEFVIRRLYRDVLEGVVAEVSYTPTVFLNGRRVESFRGPEDDYFKLLKDTISELTGETGRTR